jgi:spore germination cell wall hydrolase CwlJ-like protein
MRIRLYILVGLFLASLIIANTPALTSERIIDVQYSQLTPAAKKQVDCLAENIYYEAGHEPEDGKKAVAFVTLNRTQDPRYPKDICSVVKQKVNSTCQFTWYCEGKTAIRNYYAYEEAKRVAVFMYANYERLRDITSGALFYHADYVNPRWKLEKTVVIGRHIFYKERGGI